ncbi:MAG: hypothetical protein JWL70_1943 [Acidimicrobiia bacterium]|nr:hypothetical protein [Acidimicrobiia bacterium]
MDAPSAWADGKTAAPASAASAQQIDEAATLALYALVTQPPAAQSTASPPSSSPPGAAAAAVSTTPTYADRLATLAALVAPRAGVDANQLVAVWLRTDSRRMIAVITAIGQVGDKYKALGSGPDAFDCSGLFWFSWRQAGVSVPRNSTAIINAAKPLRQDQVQPGDVVWRPGHVMMALGLGTASVDAPETGRTVQVAPWGNVKRFGSPL